MKIAFISTAAIPTPPKNYGGIERSAAWLIEGLGMIGIEVHAFCALGSTAWCARMHTGPSETELAERLRGIYQTENFDVMIDFSHDKHAARIMDGTLPQVNNWQGQVCTWDTNPVFISRAQAAHVGKPTAPVIYHGLNHRQYPVNWGRRPGGPLLYLGALTRHKSPHLVAEAAVILGRQAYLCGPAWDDSYWPKLEECREMPGVEILSEVGGKDKINLMHRCSCLVHPIGGHGWMEAGALVVLEAMIMGIPVVGTPNGCMPEYVVDGKTGYLCADGAESIAEAVLKAEQIDLVTVMTNYDFSRTDTYAAARYAALAKSAQRGETW